MIARVRAGALAGASMLRGACCVVLEFVSLTALYRSTERGASSSPYVHAIGG